MTYESWRISYQSSEAAARSAWQEMIRLHHRVNELEAAQAQRVMRPRDCQRPECMSRGCFGHCMNGITQEKQQ